MRRSICVILVAQGIGYTARFLRQCEVAGLPATAFVKFAFEGDNTGDAATLADAVEAVVPMCFLGEAAPAPASSLLDEECDIGFADLDRVYPSVKAPEVSIPAHAWTQPVAWAALHGGLPEAE